jgi:hypothetical protein
MSPVEDFYYAFDPATESELPDPPPGREWDRYDFGKKFGQWHQRQGGDFRQGFYFGWHAALGEASPAHLPSWQDALAEVRARPVHARLKVPF